MKRPSFQFYPGDWVSNQNLRRCTFHERAIWLEVMCLMHDSDEYGILRWGLDEIASAIGCGMSDLLALIRKGVLKGQQPGIENSAGASGSPLPYTFSPTHGRKKYPAITLIPKQDGPIWFSSRMVLDEYRRAQLRANGFKSLDSNRHPANISKTPLPSNGVSKGESKGESKNPDFSPLPSNGESSGGGNGESNLGSKGGSKGFATILGENAGISPSLGNGESNGEENGGEVSPLPSKGESLGASKGGSSSSSSSILKNQTPQVKAPPQAEPGGSAGADAPFGVVHANGSKGRTPKAPTEAVDLPDWLPVEPWERFVRMRKAMRNVPFTADAQRLLLRKLEAMRSDGEDVGAALDRSVEQGWRGVFASREDRPARSPPAEPKNYAEVDYGEGGLL